MDHKKKIEEYRLRIKNKITLRFVELLDILLEWINILYKDKRLSFEQKKEVLQYVPKELLESLDKCSPTELSDDEYEELKKITFSETSELINFIIDVGNLRMTDFDLLQFNLYQIFGKDELASMIEEERKHLSETILEKIAKKLEEQEKKKEEKEEYLKKIKGMSQNELNKLIIENMFDFAPSARTPKERAEAIENNQKNVEAQKLKFRNFEIKLKDATEISKIDAQNKVYRQIRNVKQGMEKVTKAFREKAKEFVSEEGPRKMIRNSKANLSKQKERLHGEIKGKGKEWKSHFTIETKAAQSEILHKRAELLSEEKEEKEFIAKKGETEIQEARERMLGGKAEFEKDVEKAKKVFSGKSGEIDDARVSFIEKRGIAQNKFTKRGYEIEAEMYGVIHKERRRFEKEGKEARAKFNQRAVEISGHAKIYISGKKEKFDTERKAGQEKFLTKAEEIKRKPKQVKAPELESKEEFITKAEEAKSKIGRQHVALTESAKLNREKMKEEMMHKRELFLYDVRFAKYDIQEHAKQFSEKIAAKREEFETRQEQITTRHKAHQKAHIIQNLLRMIRSMH